MTCSNTESPIKIIKGEDRTLSVQLVTEGEDGVLNPFDLTGFTEIEARFRKADNTILSKLQSMSGIVVTNAVLGMLNVVLTDTETALLKEGNRLGFHIIVDIGTTRRRINLDYSISVVAPSL